MRRLFPILLLLAGCAAEPPPPPAPPEPPAPPMPAGWREILGFAPESQVASAYVQENGLNLRGAVRRAWILINFRAPTPIPGHGGMARSVRYVAEYRCANGEWRPLEGAWFARPNGQEALFAERPRRGGFHRAEPGSVDGAFVTAACGL